MKSILDRDFEYTPAAATTPERLLRKFRKIMREQQKPAQQELDDKLIRISRVRSNYGR